METKQNYGTNDADLLPFGPTAPETSQTADSSTQTARTLSTVDALTPDDATLRSLPEPALNPAANEEKADVADLLGLDLRLSFSSDGLRDSQALLVYCALDEYRRSRRASLVRHLVDDNPDSWVNAGVALAEMDNLDDLMLSITIGLQQSAKANRDAVNRVARPGSYRTPQERDEAAAQKYGETIEKLLNNAQL